jgi:hypothetical protein
MPASRAHNCPITENTPVTGWVVTEAGRAALDIGALDDLADLVRDVMAVRLYLQEHSDGLSLTSGQAQPERGSPIAG